MPFSTLTKRYANDTAFLKKVFAGAFWLSVGLLLSKLLYFIASVVLARLMTVHQYGEFGMVKSTIDNFLIFSSMGLGLTATKFISETKNTDKERASSILGVSMAIVFLLSLFICSILILFSGYISSEILKNPELKIPLIIGSSTIIFIALNSVQLGALLGLQAYKLNSLATIIQGILTCIGLVTGAVLYGINGALMGNMLGFLLTSLIIHFLLKKSAGQNQLHTTLKNWRANAKQIARFAIPASLSTLIVAPVIWMLNTSLVNTKNGYTQLGIYSAVNIFPAIIRMFNSAISDTLLPVFLSKEHEHTKTKQFLNYFGAWLFSIMLALPIIIFPQIVTAVLGEKYMVQDILPVLYLCILAAIIIANRQGVARDLIMQNKMWLSVLSMGQWALTALLLFYFLKSYGALGYAISFAGSYALNYLLFVPFFIKKRIAERSIFYNYRVHLIWLAIIALMASNLFVTNLVYKWVFTVFFTALLLYLIVLFFNNYTKSGK